MASRCDCRIDWTTSSRTIRRRVDSGQRAKPGKEFDEHAGQVMAPRRDGRIPGQHHRLHQQNHASRNPCGSRRPEQPPAERQAFQDEPGDDRQRRQAIGPGSPPHDRKQQEEDRHGQFGIGLPRGPQGVGSLAGSEHPGAEDQDHRLGPRAGRLVVVEAQQPGDSQQGNSDPRSNHGVAPLSVFGFGSLIIPPSLGSPVWGASAERPSQVFNCGSPEDRVRRGRVEVLVRARTPYRR